MSVGIDSSMLAIDSNGESRDSMGQEYINHRRQVEKQEREKELLLHSQQQQQQAVATMVTQNNSKDIDDHMTIPVDPYVEEFDLLSSNLEDDDNDMEDLVGTTPSVKSPSSSSSDEIVVKPNDVVLGRGKCCGFVLQS